MLTSGSLAALQEVLASWIAKDISKHGHYFTSRVPKMAVYGAFISAPLGHVLISILQRVFAGRTSLRAKILQIIVSNLVVCISTLDGTVDQDHSPIHPGSPDADLAPSYRCHPFRIPSTWRQWLLSLALEHSTRSELQSGLALCLS